MNNIASNIKHLRKEKGLSQEQFAQALHVTRQTVSAWERGLSQPGLETLQQMASILDVPPEQLLYGPEKAKKPFYRPVSFWPVLAVPPLYILMITTVLPLFMGLFMNTGTNECFIFCGQIFLGMLVVACYCLLKDEIRNRDYYAKEDADLSDTEE